MPPMVEMITPCKVSRMNQIIKQWLVLGIHLCTPVMHQTRVCQSQHCFNRFVHFPSNGSVSFRNKTFLWFSLFENRLIAILLIFSAECSMIPQIAKQYLCKCIVCVATWNGKSTINAPTFYMPPQNKSFSPKWPLSKWKTPKWSL